jgi:transposase
MVMLAEHYDFVIGGDPDRDTIDLAILEAGTGRVRGQTVDRTDGPAYSRLLAWARRHAPGAPRLGFGGHQQLRCRLRRDAG